MANTDWTELNGGKYKWGVVVYQRSDESQEHFVKRFSKKVQKHRILQEYKAKQVYKKPSEIRNEKKLKAVAKQKKALRLSR